MQFNNQSFNQSLQQAEHLVQQLVQQTQQASQNYQQLLQQEQQNAQRLEELAQREQRAAQVIQTALQGHQTAIQQLNQIASLCRQVEQSIQSQAQHVYNPTFTQPSHYQPAFAANTTGYTTASHGFDSNFR
ncbi:hypothetical protein DFQ01_10594 [Paenibacillus cellulosilyticus]|uniref:AMP-dependent synthetase and ligase n=1 Tax=Paenibacillus cellulosilyticus TaxID=375489 RepID=A0A2V2YVV6_9BACL|nr:hypothetical protein [Paenibacillus cellulosilyticus]PWW05111.1 hypothetical protein DFQ01_10594 [Paenibacillus cellulosilyticus]QKS48661.1 hypothetical protein HUB94_31140 [Paenibacillus cellulosilyticus]